MGVSWTALQHRPLPVEGGEQVIVSMSTEDLEELRKELADSVASASATIAEIKTLLAARDSP